MEFIDPTQRRIANRMLHQANTNKKAMVDTNYFWDLVNALNSGSFVHYPPSIRKQNAGRAEEEAILYNKDKSKQNKSLNPPTEENQNESSCLGLFDETLNIQRSGEGVDDVKPLDSFVELKDLVPKSITMCLDKLNFTTPSPIQKHAIKFGLEGRDLMCCAQTGSGKTFAFLIPVITCIYNSIDKGNRHKEFRVPVDDRGVLPQAVILAPTRELALQIYSDASRLTFLDVYHPIRTICVYGGNDIRTQLLELAYGAHIVVATPGRLTDLLDRGIVSFNKVKFLVLDEADRMLDMGFEPQINRIVLESDMPPPLQRQTLLFSATFPVEIQKLAREFLNNYIWIAVGRVGSTVENIKQIIIKTTGDTQYKYNELIDLLKRTHKPKEKTLIFVQKKVTASWLAQQLYEQNYKIEEIHGNRSQLQRETALKSFKEGNAEILIATDVASRGLDIPFVKHVIQFDMPLSDEDFSVYVHRIGRTGRAGQTGLATSFFVPGREVGKGNNKIITPLLQALRENKQEIPEWLIELEKENEPHMDHFPRAYRGPGGPPNNNYRNNPYQDIRGYKPSNYSNFQNKNNYNNFNNNGMNNNFNQNDISNHQLYPYQNNTSNYNNNNNFNNNTNFNNNANFNNNTNQFNNNYNNNYRQNNQFSGNHYNKNMNYNKNNNFNHNNNSNVSNYGNKSFNINGAVNNSNIPNSKPISNSGNNSSNNGTNNQNFQNQYMKYPNNNYYQVFNPHIPQPWYPSHSMNSNSQHNISNQIPNQFNNMSPQHMPYMIPQPIAVNNSNNNQNKPYQNKNFYQPNSSAYHPNGNEENN